VVGERAARKDIATVSGVEMFLAQGFAQWELWIDRAAPESLMRKVCDLSGVELHILRSSTDDLM
jgi:shikimate 5-dehydrogenase